MNWMKLIFAIVHHVDEIEAASDAIKKIGKSGMTGGEKKAAVITAVTTTMAVAHDAGANLPEALPSVTGQVIDAVVAAKNLTKKAA